MGKTDIRQLQQIADQFELDGTIQSIEAFGSGHINDTFRVLTDNTAGNGYLMQRINHYVFPDIAGVMRNITAVTDHLQTGLEKEARSGREGTGRPGALVAEKQVAWQQVLRVIKTRAGEDYYQDDRGNYWRFFDLITGSKSYDIVQTPQQAREGGRAFGRFQALLSDLDPQRITEVLPGFHHIGKRLESFESAIIRDTQGRVSEVTEEITFIRQHRQRMHRILEMAAAGLLPLRITHNDTKFNNLLLDTDDRALCVIDLDTVMPGFVAYDFGDAIRTVINRAAEDEADTDRIKLNIPLFEAYTQGYMESAGDFLTTEEVASLIDGVLLLPYMQAVRFLTDYLEGDQYFKIKHTGHNLQRTRAQLRLVWELMGHEQVLVGIIEQAADRRSSN